MKQVEIIDIPTNVIRLDLQDLEGGLYYLQTTVNKKSIATKKLLVR